MPELSRGLFTIRIYTAPLTEVLAGGNRRRALLASAIRSMSEEVLAYKRLTELREPLLAYLQA